MKGKWHEQIINRNGREWIRKRVNTGYHICMYLIKEQRKWAATQSKEM